MVAYLVPAKNELWIDWKKSDAASVDFIDKWQDFEDSQEIVRVSTSRYICFAHRRIFIENKRKPCSESGERITKLYYQLQQ